MNIDINLIRPLAVSPAQAARLASVGRTTIYAAMKTGALRSSKIGKRRLITIAAIEEWLASMEAPLKGYANVR